MHVFLRKLLLCCCLQASYGHQYMNVPDFDTGWKDLWIDKTRSESSRTVFHRLEEVPLLVDVQIKMADGYIFPAAGHLIQNNDLRPDSEHISENGCYDTPSHGQSGVIYLYNRTFVKVIAMVTNNNTQFRRCSYTAVSPNWDDTDTGGIMSSKFRIRAWKPSSLPEPDFVVNNTHIASGKEDLSMFNFTHGFGKYPELVISRVYFHLTCCSINGFYADSLGASAVIPCDTSENYGYVVYGYDKENISVWTGSNPRNKIFVASDGAGKEVRITHGYLEIYAWNSNRFKSNIEKAKNAEAQSSNEHPSTSLEPAGRMVLKENTLSDSTFVRGFVQSFYKNNTELRATGTGTILWYQYNTTLCSFGGMTYGYADNVVNFWYPDIHPYCAMICPFIVQNETRTVVNGTCFYETGVNGTGVNGTGVNETVVDRTGVNGTGVNETGVNETGVNGTCVNETVVDRTGVNGTGGNETDVSGTNVYGTCVNETLQVTTVVKIWNVDEDECLKYPCRNNGRCVNLRGGYNCQCTSGWTGVNCTTDINECDELKPCNSINTAECVDGLDHYSCLCKPGWAGKNCQLEAKPSVVLNEEMPSTERTIPESTEVNNLTQALIILGTELFDISTLSEISGRYDCSKYTLFMYRVNNQPRSVSLQVHRLTYKSLETDPVWCKINWGDGSATDIHSTEAYTTIVHTFTNYGVYRILLTCNDTEGQSYCPETDTTCFSTTNFLDDLYNSFDTPKKVFGDEPFEINSYIYNVNTSCDSPTFNWRIVEISGTQMIPFTDFRQPNSGRLGFNAGSVKPGIYVVILEILFPDKSSIYWLEDSIVIKIILRDLFTYILGGDFLYVPLGRKLHINANVSHDPNAALRHVLPTELVATWTFENTNTSSDGSPLADADLFTVIQTRSTTNFTRNSYKVQHGTEYILEIDTSFFQLNSYGIIVFTMSRDTRKSSYMQVIKFVDNMLPLSIRCVYNCHAINGIINYDNLTLDTQLEKRLDKSLLAFEWEVFEWKGVESKHFKAGVKSYLKVSRDTLTQGSSYLFIVTVNGSGFLPGKVAMVRTIDYVPYNGNCSLDTNNVTSAYEWVLVRCESWIVKSMRLKQGTSDDNNPILSYYVKQVTAGAVIEEDVITQTSNRHFYVMLKVGDPRNAYRTSLVIRVHDIFDNYNETVIGPVTSKPVFSVEKVNATDAGAELVRSYASNEYEAGLRSATGVNSMQTIAYFISAVCSNIHLIELPVMQPVLPRVLYDDGAIIDLKANMNTKEEFSNALTQAYQHLPDVATLVLQDLLRNMSDVMKALADDDPVSDKKLESVKGNAFTNLAANAQFLDRSIVEDIVNLSRNTGINILAITDSDKIQEVGSEVFKMSEAVAYATVPGIYDQYRSVADIYDGMEQISDLLSVIGQNINIYDASMSPGERAFLYMTLQRVMFYYNVQAQHNAKGAAHAVIGRADEILEKTNLCEHCSRYDRNEKQLLNQGTVGSLRNGSLHTHTSSFTMGLEDVLGSEDDDQVSTSAFELEKNVFMYDNDGTSSLITSNVLRVDVKASGRYVIPGYLTFWQKVGPPETKLVVPSVDEEDASEFMYHKFVYQRSTEYVCIIIKPLTENNFTEYAIYVKFKGPPTIIDFDIRTNVKEENRWYTCLSPKQMNGHKGIAYLAVHLNGIRKVTNYSLTMATMACLTWEEKTTRWRTDKCQLTEWFYEAENISCLCKEITDMVFGNSFFVAPNSIDFSAIFLKFSPLNQAAVLGTLAGLFVIYIVSVVFLSRLDRRDKLKWGMTPLRDNLMNHTQYYIITVMTGLRHRAGTRSRVAFILSGEYEHTGHREMFDGVRQEFSTGSVVSFLMATKTDLGDLHSLQIWHDNSGTDHYAAWYLNQVDVYDVERQKKYSFVAERWLSLETGLEAHLPSSHTDRPLKFESRFFHHVRERLSEGHMLISILYRPRMSSFTRVQRVSCALVFIMLNMIASAMYFNPEPEYESPASLQLGPFRFTPQQIYVSLVCALMTTLPTLLLMFLFKRTKGIHEGSGTICKCCCTCFTKNPSKTHKQRHYEASLKALLVSPEIPVFKGGIHFPHFFVYLEWLIVLCGIVAPSFFIVAFSMEWGKQKSEEWLTTMFLSLFESVVLVDPLSVVCVSFVLSVLVCIDSKEADYDVTETINNYRRMIGKADDKLSTSVSVLKSLVKEFKSYVASPRMVTQPLQGDKLKHAALKHRHHKKFLEIVGDVQVNLIFILIVSVICYSNRDTTSYYHHSEIVNALVHPRGTPGFHAIKNAGHMYNWLNLTLIPYLFLERDELGTLLHWTERQFTKDYTNLRLGPPRLRQLRIKNDTCSVPYFGHISCYGEYFPWKEDEEEYCIGWKTPPCPISEITFNVSTAAWTFTSALETWGLPLTGYVTTYGGGGYIASLDVNLNNSIHILNELYRNTWIDRQTRAVVVEYTLYNAATNTFTYNIFMIEFPPTGGIFTFFSIYPVKLYTHHGPVGILILVCELLFVLYLLFMLCKICVRIYRQRSEYFGSFWRVFDLVQFVVGVTAIVLFIMRLVVSLETINSFKRNKKVFVNFSHIVFWDQALVSVLSVLSFMTTTRVLEAFTTLNKLKAIAEIFKSCGKELFWYGLTFLHVFVGFCVLASLLFGSTLESYRNLYQCMGTLFIAMIGKSRFTEINKTQPVLAKVFFVTYIFLVVYFILTIFLSILGATIDNVVHNSRVNSEDDLIQYLVEKFRALFRKPRKKRKIRAAQYEASEPSFTMTAKERLLNKRRRRIHFRPHTGDSLNYVQTGPTQEVLDARINRKRIPKKRRPMNHDIFTAI